MAVEWTDEEEIVLLKGLIRHRPLGIHQHFRLIALFLRLNRPDDDETDTRRNEEVSPKFSIKDIRSKLDSLYDTEYLHKRAIDPLDGTDENDSGSDDGAALFGFKESYFTLPYHEYLDIIEDHARIGSESVGQSPSVVRDLRSSPTQSHKTESVMPEDTSDIEPSMAQISPSPADTKDQAPPPPQPARRGRKRTATTSAVSASPAAKSARTTTTKRAGSIADSVGTPGEDTRSESEPVTATAAATVTKPPATRKTSRPVPSRKSTRKK